VINAVDRGELSVTEGAKQVAEQAQERLAKNGKRRPTKTPKMEKSHAMKRERARYWHSAVGAVEALTSLPAATDVVLGCANPQNRSGMASKVTRAIAWLTKFQRSLENVRDTDAA